MKKVFNLQPGDRKSAKDRKKSATGKDKLDSKQSIDMKSKGMKEDSIFQYSSV